MTNMVENDPLPFLPSGRICVQNRTVQDVIKPSEVLTLLLYNTGIMILNLSQFNFFNLQTGDDDYSFWFHRSGGVCENLCF